MKKSLAALLILCGFSVSAEAQIAKVGNATISNGNAGTTQTSAPINVSGMGAVSLIVICNQTYDGTNGVSADSSGNTYTALTKYTGTASSVQMFYKENPTISSSQTFTITGGAISGEILFFTGTQLSGSFDTGTDHGIGLGSPAATIQPGSTTPSVNGDVLVSCLQTNGSTSETINQSFTDVDHLTYGSGGNAFGQGGGDAFLVQTTAAAVNPTWTPNSTSAQAASIAAFKTAGSSPATLYKITDPTPDVGVRGTASGNFTVTPDGTATGTITITPSGGGLSTPIVLTFSGSATPQTFTITPTLKGVVVLTCTNTAGLTDPLPDRYTSLPKINAIFKGDSLTLGTGSSTGGYPAAAMTYLQGANSFFNGVNLGTAGQRLDDMLANEGTEIPPYFNSSYDYNILLIEGGTNDIGGYGGAAEPASYVYNTMVTYCANAKSYGFTVIPVTITPAAGTPITVYPANFNTIRDQYNNLLRGGIRGPCDGLVDTAANSNIGWSGEQTNGSYFNPDQIHMYDSGYSIVGAAAAAAIAQKALSNAPAPWTHF